MGSPCTCPSSYSALGHVQGHHPHNRHACAPIILHGMHTVYEHVFVHLWPAQLRKGDLPVQLAWESRLQVANIFLFIFRIFVTKLACASFVVQNAQAWQHKTIVGHWTALISRFPVVWPNCGIQANKSGQLPVCPSPRPT